MMKINHRGEGGREIVFESDIILLKEKKKKKPLFLLYAFVKLKMLFEQIIMHPK